MALAPSIETRPSAAKLAILILNSAALYVLAYMLMHIVLQLSEAIMSYRYVIPTIWNPSKLDFQIQNTEWRRTWIVLVFSVGHILCLVIGGIAFLRLQDAQEKRGLTKLFYFWLVIQGCNHFFGAMAADNFVLSGFCLAPLYLFIETKVPSIGLAFLFGNICLVIGYKLSVSFLKTCDSISLIRLENRPLLIWTTIFAPWLVGTIVINATKFPVMTLLEESHQFSVLLLLIPLAVGSRFQMYEMTVEAPRKTRLSGQLISLTIISLALFRLLLNGIYFKPHGYTNFPGRQVADKIRE
jgi:hypothetical protein